MQISVFGSLTVKTDERILGPGDLGGIKPKEILEILLLARGRPVTKQELADRLWPQTMPKDAAATLESHISRLRGTLFEDRTTAREILTTGNGSYQLCLDQLSVDIEEFDQIVARADRLGADRFDLLRRAMELASGDILECSPSAPWLESIREVYRDRVARVCVLMGTEYLMNGDYIRAIGRAERAIQIRPFSEEAVRVLMLANLGLGQPGLACEAYRRCCVRLEEELGVDCTTETAEMAGAIDAGATVGELLPALAGPEAALAVETTGPRERRSATRRLAFVGRKSELRQVRTAIERSYRRQFSLVFVQGRPGIGRTSFLNELGSCLEGAVGRYSYSPLESEAPRLPLADAICDALSGLPELIDATHYASSANFDCGEHTLSALCRLLHIDAPIVLLLDDFQWADSCTVEMIGRLMREMPGLPVTVVAAVRESASRESNGHDFLTPTETVRLRCLQADAVDGSETADHELVQSAGGTPWLMADAYRWQRAGNSGPSPSLIESVLRMVRGMGGVYPALLAAAAGQTAPFDLAALGSANSPDRSFDLDDLQDLCELEILEQADGGFRFRSPIMRAALADGVL